MTTLDAHVRPLPRWLTDSPAMAAAATLWAAATPLYALLVLLVPDTIAGEAAWLKPLKFSVATAVWAGTLAWAARFVAPATREATWFRLYGWSVFAAMAAEMAWLTTASAMVQKAHYNTEVAWLEALYPVAGIVATYFAASAAVWGVAILRAATWPFARTLGWSMVATFALTVPVAFALSAVEPPEAGLPLMGWTFGAGDLRPAHFAATHAMQAIPLIVLATGLGGRAAVLGWSAVTLGLAALGSGLI